MFHQTCKTDLWCSTKPERQVLSWQSSMFHWTWKTGSKLPVFDVPPNLKDRFWAAGLRCFTKPLKDRSSMFHQTRRTGSKLPVFDVPPNLKDKFKAAGLRCSTKPERQVLIWRFSMFHQTRKTGSNLPVFDVPPNLKDRSSMFHQTLKDRF